MTAAMIPATIPAMIPAVIPATTPVIRRLPFPVALALLALSPGCGLELRQRLAGVNNTIKEARDNGAYKCAPRELAMAESHSEFTADELDYGNYFGARSELEIATTNAKAAFEHSPRERCNPPPIPPDVDTDGDGLFDKVDRCPKLKGPRENAGCPWPDRDGDTVLDKDDKCPDEPGPVPNKGCPYTDRDKDTVLDKDDGCPDEPGPVENKGCPFPDRDKDGVLDKFDRCPDEPGPKENEGCPYKLITLTKDKIELKQKVYFDTDKATIKPQSFDLLNEIADVIVKGDLEVRIEGHTDSRASKKHNLKLSQARANSVRDYIVNRGADPARLTSIGYGPNRPISDNRTAPGREANRRVEFFLSKQ